MPPWHLLWFKNLWSNCEIKVTYLILTVNMNFASVKNFLKQFCASGRGCMVQIHIQLGFHLENHKDLIFELSSLPHFFCVTKE